MTKTKRKCLFLTKRENNAHQKKRTRLIEKDRKQEERNWSGAYSGRVFW